MHYLIFANNNKIRQYIVQNFYTKNSILIFLPANNFSEEEYLTTNKVFQKAGKNVFITSDSNSVCCGDKGLKVKADIHFYNVNQKNFSSIVLIGGKGSKLYWDNLSLHKILKSFKGADKIVAAICSAPIILARAGLLSKIPAACWQEDKNELINSGIEYQDRSVVVEREIITAEGPQSAEQFAETVLNMIK
jgi:protease I